MKKPPQKNGGAERFATAKALMTAAAQASIDGSPDDVQLATEALRELKLATAGESEARP
jgi:hypothetical protein